MDWIVINLLPSNTHSAQHWVRQGCLFLGYRRWGHFLGFSRLGCSCSVPQGQSHSWWLRRQDHQPEPKGTELLPCGPWVWNPTPVGLRGGTTTMVGPEGRASCQRELLKLLQLIKFALLGFWIAWDLTPLFLYIILPQNENMPWSSLIL